MSVLDIDGNCPPDLGEELEDVIWSYLRPDDRMQRERIGMVRHPEHGEGRSEALALSSAAHRLAPRRGPRRRVRPVETGYAGRADGSCNALRSTTSACPTPSFEALAARGIDAPFPIQAMVIEDATEGRDTLAKSKTGSGKTLGFAIPIVEQLDPDSNEPSRGAGAGAHPRARDPGQGRLHRHRQGQAPQGEGRLRRHQREGAGQGRRTRRTS